VIESDDWGSIRMPDKKTVDFLKTKGLAVEKCPYVMNDCLESNDDLEVLFEFIEKKNKHTVITANFLTANPNFQKIKESNFRTYHYEFIEKTLKNYPRLENVISHIK
jgi:hypothetical protein